MEEKNKSNFTFSKDSDLGKEMKNKNYFTRISPEVGRERNKITSSTNKILPSSDEVENWLSDYRQDTSQKELLKLSEGLYSTSRHYQLLIQYYSDMPKWSYVIVPRRNITYRNSEKLEEEYYEVAEMAKSMNMRQEFNKVLKNALMRDVFYGYVYESRNGYYIQRFDNSICKISSVEDGVFNFAINMKSFTKREEDLLYYPLEIQKAYEEWKKEYESKSRSKNKISDYIELNPKNTICIKVNETLRETVPPFAGVFDSLFEIKGFKQSRKNQENLNNYMLLLQKIPMRDSNLEVNDFTLDNDAVTYFHNVLTSVLPDNIGAITSPMNVESIKFDRDKIDIDNVSKSERDFWQNAGVSQSLFSSDNSTSEGIRQSLKVDENTVFNILKQFERWINRFIYLNSKKRSVDFMVNILPVTAFNQQDVYKIYLESATYGIPVKSHLSSAIGLEPLDMLNMLHIENNVFTLDRRLIPLASSHTMATNPIVDGENGGVEIGLKEQKSAGRPSNEESGNTNSDETDKKDNKID